MKKIIVGIFCFIFSIIVIFNVLARFNISFAGFRVFKIETSSMHPNFEINDLVILEERNNYEVSDVVVFKNEYNEYITQRIVEINENEIITNGDAGTSAKEKVNQTGIIGKVIYKFKYLKFIHNFFSKPLPFIIMIVTGILIIVFIPGKKKEENPYKM